MDHNIYLRLNPYVALLPRLSADRPTDANDRYNHGVVQMAKTAKGTVGTTARGTQPMVTRGNQQVEVRERRRRQGEVRGARALAVPPLPRRLREADDRESTVLAQRAAGRSRSQDIDRHVGARVRDRRIFLGLTQQQMAELIGVTYQQAHKNEKGINRVPAGRLYNIAQALGVDVSYFFESLGSDKAFSATPQQRMLH
jgi:DNA-binding XRE family transcriptional regulator